jgi:hypothetical protein
VDLPFLDEHSVTVAASPQAVWDGAVRVFEGFSAAAPVAWLLGCEPGRSSGWEDGPLGATVPGFRVVEASRPALLVLAGQHRFSRYAIVIRVSPVGSDTRCSLESRAEFPGLHGRLYRLAVVTSRGHVLAVRRLLHQIARAADTVDR